MYFFVPYCRWPAQWSGRSFRCTRSRIRSPGDIYGVGSLVSNNLVTTPVVVTVFDIPTCKSTYGLCIRECKTWHVSIFFLYICTYIVLALHVDNVGGRRKENVSRRFEKSYRICGADPNVYDTLHAFDQRRPTTVTISFSIAAPTIVVVQWTEKRRLFGQTSVSVNEALPCTRRAAIGQSW